MLVGECFDDPILGSVTWAGSGWSFEFALRCNRLVPAVYLPGERIPSTAERDWAGVRAIVRLLQTSEIAVRAFIRQRVCLRPRPTLGSVLFVANQQARLYYTSCNNLVTVQIDPTGRFVSGPTLSEVQPSSHDED